MHEGGIYTYKKKKGGSEKTRKDVDERAGRGNKEKQQKRDEDWISRDAWRERKILEHTLTKINK